MVMRFDNRYCLVVTFINNVIAKVRAVPRLHYGCAVVSGKPDFLISFDTHTES